MKFVLVLIALMIALPVQAATEISDEMANQYYDNCLKGQAPNLSQQTQQTMCACTAAQMKTGFTVEDMQAMSKKDEAARLAFNKMIINVYAPCIQYPAYDYYYSVCSADPRTASMTNNPQAMCNCLAGKVSGYLGQNSTQVFQDLLTRQPFMTDPMMALTNDPQFDQFAQSQLLTCVP